MVDPAGDDQQAAGRSCDVSDNQNGPSWPGLSDWWLWVYDDAR